MVSSKMIYTFAVLFVAFLAPSYTSAQGASSPPPPPPGPEPVEGDFGNFFRFPFNIGRIFNSLFRFIQNGGFQSVWYDRFSGFSVETCSEKQSPSSCIFQYINSSQVNGNASCTYYTIGNCETQMKSLADQGCVHKCRLGPADADNATPPAAVTTATPSS